jgi:hypothetical protein
VQRHEPVLACDVLWMEEVEHSKVRTSAGCEGGAHHA